MESHDECPTCNQMIEKDFRFARVGALQGRGKKLSKELDKIKLNIDDLLRVITEADDLSMQCHEKEVISLRVNVILLGLKWKLLRFKMSCII